MSLKSENLSSDDIAGLGAEISPDEIQEKRLERYAAAKRRTVHLADYIKKSSWNPNDHRIASIINECGEYIIYRHFYQKDIWKLIGGCTCKKHLLCTLCAIRRGAKQLRAYLEKVEQVMPEYDYQLGMITFTVKNGDDLKERFEHIKGALQKIMDRRKKRLSMGRGEYTVMAYVKGAVWTYEVTKGDKGWHPHIHMLVLMSPDVDMGKLVKGEDGVWRKTMSGDFEDLLSDEWKEITGDSWVVDVRPIDAERDRVGAFVEVFKYALKTGDLEPGDQFQAYKTLRGKRLIASCGCLYGVQVQDEGWDTIEAELELEPYVDLLYRYSETFGYQLYDEITLRNADSRIRAARKNAAENAGRGINEDARPGIDRSRGLKRESISEKDPSGSLAEY